MVVAFAGMVFAIDHLVRSYSYDEIETALSSLPAWVILASLGLLAADHALLCVREWLAIDYAGRRDLGPARTALASVVSRSLSTLGVASITGLGLRLRIYSGWGLDTGDVAKVTTYDELTFVVGLASQCAFVFGLLPVPPALAAWIPVVLVRAIGIAAAGLIVAYVVVCARGPREIRIRSLAIPVPMPKQIAGTILIPVVDLVLGALIVHLCLPSGLALGLSDIVVVCLISSVAGSLTQIPAGLGVLESFTLMFARAPDAEAAIIGGLLVRRIITNLVPIVVGGVLLGGIELRRRPDTPRPEWLAESTAVVLSTFTFLVGVIVMVLSTSPLSDHLGDLGQAAALASGTGILFLSRGLVLRSRRAWQITFALVLARAIVGVVVPPSLFVSGTLLALGLLLVLSRTVFDEHHRLVDGSPRWWIAFAIAIAGTAWSAFVLDGRHVTPRVVVRGGVMLAVTAVVVASLAVHVLRSRRQRRRAPR